MKRDSLQQCLIRSRRPRADQEHHCSRRVYEAYTDTHSREIMCTCCAASGAVAVRYLMHLSMDYCSFCRETLLAPRCFAAEDTDAPRGFSRRARWLPGEAPCRGRLFTSSDESGGSSFDSRAPELRLQAGSSLDFRSGPGKSKTLAAQKFCKEEIFYGAGKKIQ